MGGCFSGGNSRAREDEVEYSEDDIRRKFDRMPTLTQEERIVLKSSWKVIRRKVNTVSHDMACRSECFLNNLEKTPPTLFRKERKIPKLDFLIIHTLHCCFCFREFSFFKKTPYIPMGDDADFSHHTRKCISMQRGEREG